MSFRFKHISLNSNYTCSTIESCTHCVVDCLIGFSYSKCFRLYIYIHVLVFHYIFVLFPTCMYSPPFNQSCINEKVDEQNVYLLLLKSLWLTTLICGVIRSDQRIWRCNCGANAFHTVVWRRWSVMQQEGINEIDAVARRR